MNNSEDRAATLAGAILDLEQERQGAADRVSESAVSGPLPGQSEGDLSLRDALRLGGMTTFTTLAFLSLVDELESGALGILGPDVRDTLNISEGVMTFIGTASASFMVMGALPMGWLADRIRRGRIMAWANLCYGLLVALSGFAVNGLMLFLSRMFAGVTKANQLSVRGSLVADLYPISTRGRVGSLFGVISAAPRALSPLAAGALATAVGGTAGWRWALVVLAVPIVIASLMAFRLPEPPRGQFEKKDVLGEVIAADNSLPISLEAATGRLMQVRTFKGVVVAFSALGFGIFTVPVVGGFFLEEEYGLDSFARGVVVTVTGLGVMPLIPFVGKWFDRSYRDNPAKAVKVVAYLLLPTAVLVPLQFSMPNEVLYAAVGIPVAALTMAAFTLTAPLFMAVTPYRLRGSGQALGALYLALIGGTGGSVLMALLQESYSRRVSVTLLIVPSTLIGAYLMIRTSRSIEDDLALVAAELREEQQEYQRRASNPDQLPALQVNQIDFSYGPVQILFDVDFEVRRGEVLALLGTNGAGKSTILRVIAGLGVPSRGVVRHHGRTITYVTPELRAKLGIRMLPGGKGVFNELSVHDNLSVAAFPLRRDRPAQVAAIDEMYDLFPELRDRRDVSAMSLSGGQQQMLALAQVLVTQPDILIIDELSLGLAPIMVQRLIDVIHQLRAKEMTIIVVEQSLNVAMAIADRAVFLEKGQVRFEGPIAELAARDDLARAVFLGAEGG